MKPLSTLTSFHPVLPQTPLTTASGAAVRFGADVPRPAYALNYFIPPGQEGNPDVQTAKRECDRTWEKRVPEKIRALFSTHQANQLYLALHNADSIGAFGLEDKLRMEPFPEFPASVHNPDFNLHFAMFPIVRDVETRGGRVIGKRLGRDLELAMLEEWGHTFDRIAKSPTVPIAVDPATDIPIHMMSQSPEFFELWEQDRHDICQKATGVEQNLLDDAMANSMEAAAKAFAVVLMCEDLGNWKPKDRERINQLADKDTLPLANDEFKLVKHYFKRSTGHIRKVIKTFQ